LPLIEPIVAAKGNWQSEFTHERRTRLFTYLGQPAVARVLDAMKGCENVNAVNTILEFMGYLCRNVAYTLPVDAYERVMNRVPREWQRMLHPELVISHAHASEDTQQCETPAERAQRMQTDAANGIVYHWRQLCERGVFPHMENSQGIDTSGDKPDCSKQASHTPGCTCECVHVT
jgi:hypothetical protein